MIEIGKMATRDGVQYEIVEWAYAVIEGGDTGIEFLGSQGDSWDAQKDMLADTIGAVFILWLFWIVRPDLEKQVKLFLLYCIKFKQGKIK